MPEGRFPELWRSPFEIARRMSEAMEDLFGIPGRFTGRAYELGRTDIYEKEGNLVYETELPGVEKRDVKVRLEEDCLIISGERKRKEKVERENYIRMGRSYGSFQRTFPLPEKVEAPQNIKAEFKDGVLKVMVPLQEPLKKEAVDIKID